MAPEILALKLYPSLFNLYLIKCLLRHLKEFPVSFLFCFFFFNRIAEIIRLLWLVPSGRSSNPVFVSSLEYSSDNVNIASYMMNIWWILSFHCLRGCQTHKSEHFGTLAHWQVSELYYLCIASIYALCCTGKNCSRWTSWYSTCNSCFIVWYSFHLMQLVLVQLSYLVFIGFSLLKKSSIISKRSLPAV